MDVTPALDLDSYIRHDTIMSLIKDINGMIADITTDDASDSS
jgi:hypothetical protein